jgi:PmbA/TldA metallopeptidase C-terminal domain
VPGLFGNAREVAEETLARDTFVDFDRNLNIAINKLREAPGGSAGNPRFVDARSRQPISLVDNGAVTNLAYARQTAHKVGKEAPSHGFPLPNEYGEAPMNIVMDGGRASVEGMVASTERCLLVTRV